jgi:hypothetical protein
MHEADANAKRVEPGREMRRIAHADGVNRRAVRLLDGANERA